MLPRLRAAVYAPGLDPAPAPSPRLASSFVLSPDAVSGSSFDARSAQARHLGEAPGASTGCGTHSYAVSEIHPRCTAAMYCDCTVLSSAGSMCVDTTQVLDSGDCSAASRPRAQHIRARAAARRRSLAHQLLARAAFAIPRNSCIGFDCAGLLGAVRMPGTCYIILHSLIDTLLGKFVCLTTSTNFANSHFLLHAPCRVLPSCLTGQSATPGPSAGGVPCD